MVKGKTEITGPWPQLSVVGILFLKKKVRHLPEENLKILLILKGSEREIKS